MNKRKTAIYIRTSTLKQDQGAEAQQRALEEHLKSKGVDDYLIYCDAGVSGTKTSRPQLDNLMHDCRNGSVSTVIVYSFSRFARSTRHLLTALDEFKELKIQFISLTEALDSSSAMGAALFTIIAAISQLERELIRERVINGLKNVKAKGKKLGRRRTRNSQLIQELAKLGKSHREIARLASCSKTTVFRELQATGPKLAV